MVCCDLGLCFIAVCDVCNRNTSFDVVIDSEVFLWMSFIRQNLDFGELSSQTDPEKFQAFSWQYAIKGGIILLVNVDYHKVNPRSRVGVGLVGDFDHGIVQLLLNGVRETVLLQRVAI